MAATSVFAGLQLSLSQLSQQHVATVNCWVIVSVKLLTPTTQQEKLDPRVSEKIVSWMLREFSFQLPVAKQVCFDEDGTEKSSMLEFADEPHDDEGVSSSM